MIRQRVQNGAPLQMVEYLKRRHGPLTLIQESAMKMMLAGNAHAVEEQIVAKYPAYRVKQFLTAFSIPAFFPAAPSA